VVDVALPGGGAVVVVTTRVGTVVVVVTGARATVPGGAAPATVVRATANARAAVAATGWAAAMGRAAATGAAFGAGPDTAAMAGDGDTVVGPTAAIAVLATGPWRESGPTTPRLAARALPAVSTMATVETTRAVAFLVGLEAAFCAVTTSLLLALSGPGA
jgi:hypothetical protein